MPGVPAAEAGAGGVPSLGWYTLSLLACCPLPALLSFSFLRRLLPVGCRFLTCFCLASYRGVGVGCEAPHLRSISSPNFPHGFCALLILYASASTGFQKWDYVMVSPFPSIVEEALFLRGRGIIARSLRAHLSGAF